MSIKPNCTLCNEHMTYSFSNTWMCSCGKLYCDSCAKIIAESYSVGVDKYFDNCPNCVVPESLIEAATLMANIAFGTHSSPTFTDSINQLMLHKKAWRKANIQPVNSMPKEKFEYIDLGE